MDKLFYIVVLAGLVAVGYYIFKPKPETPKAEPPKQEQAQTTPEPVKAPEPVKEPPKAPEQPQESLAQKIQKAQEALDKKQAEYTVTAAEVKKFKAGLNKIQSDPCGTDCIKECQAECKALLQKINLLKQDVAAKDKEVRESTNAVSRASASSNDLKKTTDERIGWRWVSDAPNVVRSMSSLPSKRTKPVKYIYKKGMSDKQEAAVNIAKQDLEKDKQALDAVKNQLHQAENEYKSACERYKSEAQNKFNQANEKLSGLAKEKADIEKVIKDLQV